MNITEQQYMTLVRALLNLGGGALVTSGAISGSGLETVSGLIIPLATMLWGFFVHSPQETVKRADQFKAKGVA